MSDFPNIEKRLSSIERYVQENNALLKSNNALLKSIVSKPEQVASLGRRDDGEENATLSKDNLGRIMSGDPRAVFRNLVSKKTSAAQIFTFIIAFLSVNKGEDSFSSNEVKIVWGECAGIFGKKYQSIHATRARDGGYVTMDNSEAKGRYRITESGVSMICREYELRQKERQKDK